MEPRFKLRLGTVFPADDVEGAIALAEELKGSGKYNLFRGQHKPWPPISSLGRRILADPEFYEKEYLPRVERFWQWVSTTPGLEDLVADADHLLAVAQHYGIPTHFIDFTTEPAVAAYFAAENQPSGAEGCIFCLNTTELLDDWGDLLKVRSGDPQLEVLELKVRNLWRLEAQRGVFLYCPTTWHDLWEMDMIVFPVRAMPVRPLREEVYPERKSPLEELLDNYFEAEAAPARTLSMLKFIEDVGRARGQPIPTLWAQSVSGDVRTEFFAAVPEVRADWIEARSAGWLTVPTEDLAGSRPTTEQLRVNPDIPVDQISRMVAAAVLRVINQSPSLRNSRVEWRVTGNPSGSRTPHDENLDRALDRLWDGMRRLPYSTQDIASAIGVTIELYRRGVWGMDGSGGRKPTRAMFGDEVARVDLVHAEETAGSALVAQRDLASCLRPDLATLLAPQYVARATDMSFLLQVCMRADRLFQFAPFARLLARQMIPTQLWRAPAGIVVFSPARISRFGLT